MKLIKEELKLYANPAAVITQFLQFAGEGQNHQHYPAGKAVG